MPDTHYNKGTVDNPCDININPEEKVFVADINNSRILVFHSNWTLFHIIDEKVSGDSSFIHPEGISLDLSGSSNSVTVFSVSGKFVY